MRRKSAAALLDLAAEAASETEAVEILVAGGWPRSAAQETAAIMFGTSKGDCIEVDAADGQPPIPLSLSAEQLARAEIRTLPCSPDDLEPDSGAFDRETGTRLDNDTSA